MKQFLLFLVEEASNRFVKNVIKRFTSRGEETQLPGFLDNGERASQQVLISC